MYASGHSFGWFCLPRPATARRLSRLASLEIWCASHAPILQSEPAHGRPPSIYGSSPRCVHAPRGGHASAPPAALVADAPHHPTVGTHARRAPRTTHRAHAARTTLIAAHCTAHRAAPRTTRQAAPRCATHHPCALAIVGPGPPGAAAHKRTPGAHPFSRAVFVGARACRPFCTTRRAAPRTLRHAAPRCATHAADVITLAGAPPNDPGRLLVSVWV